MQDFRPFFGRKSGRFGTFRSGEISVDQVISNTKILSTRFERSNKDIEIDATSVDTVDDTEVGKHSESKVPLNDDSKRNRSLMTDNKCHLLTGSSSHIETRTDLQSVITTRKPDVRFDNASQNKSVKMTDAMDNFSDDG